MRELLKKLGPSELEALSAEVLRRLDGAAPPRSERGLSADDNAETSQTPPVEDDDPKTPSVRWLRTQAAKATRVFSKNVGAMNPGNAAPGYAAEAFQQNGSTIEKIGNAGAAGFLAASRMWEPSAEGVGGAASARRNFGEMSGGNITENFPVSGSRAAASARAGMNEVSDFFRRDARRYDNGFELY